MKGKNVHPFIPGPDPTKTNPKPNANPNGTMAKDNRTTLTQLLHFSWAVQNKLVKAVNMMNCCCCWCPGWSWLVSCPPILLLSTPSRSKSYMSWTQFRSSDKLDKVLLVASGAQFQQLKLKLNLKLRLKSQSGWLYTEKQALGIIN